MFVPMHIPQYSRDGSSTILFQLNTERNSLSISLKKCLDGSHDLKDPEEVMFPTLDRTQVRFLKLIIAVSPQTLDRLQSLSSVPVAWIR